MKRYFYLILTLLPSSHLLAQLPEDALRQSWNSISGTARHQAIGGAMVSLGGEITALFVNPAGLGLYKTGEFVLTPGISFLGGKSDFRGNDAKAENKTQFNFGTTGFVWGYGNKYSRWTSKAFSVAVNRTANYNNTIYYNGQNDYSTYAEPLANEFANSGLTIDQALNSSDISMQTKMALYTYLVDTLTTGGATQVIARSEQSSLLDQNNKIVTKGGATEIALGFAANMDDKLYLGLGLGIPIINYERISTYREDDATGAGNNEFSFSEYTETYESKGVGFNLKLGLIFKPVEQFRLGFAIHTPTWMGLTDNVTAGMTTNIDTATGSVKQFSVKSADLYGGTDPEYNYDLQTPWKFMVSGSYVIREIEDVTRQKGFITADVEYVGHTMSRFSSSNTNSGLDVSNYDELNDAIKAVYKGAFNFRVGGELKFNTIMGRLGFAYYGSPYESDELKAHRMNISGGLGYRNKGVFIDLTYVHALVKDVNFPYFVDAPRTNTFAELNQRSSNILLTVGFKF